MLAVICAAAAALNAGYGITPAAVRSRGGEPLATGWLPNRRAALHLAILAASAPVLPALARPARPAERAPSDDDFDELTARLLARQRSSIAPMVKANPEPAPRAPAAPAPTPSAAAATAHTPTAKQALPPLATALPKQASKQATTPPASASAQPKQDVGAAVAIAALATGGVSYAYAVRKKEATGGAGMEAAVESAAAVVQARAQDTAKVAAEAAEKVAKVRKHPVFRSTRLF